MKTYKTISTVTVVLANGETVVYENASLYPAGSKAESVYNLETGVGMRTYTVGEYQSITRTVECRGVKKRVVFIARDIDGNEYERDTFAPYGMVRDAGGIERFHSIRREEREELA